MMKKLVIIQSVMVLMLCTSFTTKNSKVSSTCDITNFYKAIEPNDRDTKVLTSSGDLEDVEIILVPTKLDIGAYKIELTRKGANLYKVEHTDMYIETKYCYEYATYQDVILKVTSSYGYTKGTLIFD